MNYCITPKTFRYITAVLYCMSFTYSNGQYFTINGSVVDENTRETLPGATLTLMQESDSSLVAGTNSDSLGNFKIGNTRKGLYYLQITYVGYKEKKIAVPILNENLGLGVIELKPSDILLNAVTISDDKSVVEYDFDKKIYNVGLDISSEAKSASEVLQNIPSVSVDIEGAVSLRNSTNIAYFINGQPSAMLRRNARNVLRQISAKSIERIEVITNPSAKYRPDGIGGIINIVLKKNSDEGFNGQLGANAGIEKRYNANINLNYSKEDFNLYGNYGIRHSFPTYMRREEREYKGNKAAGETRSYTDNGTSNRDALAHNILAGINYSLTDQDELELSGTYFLQNTVHNTRSAITIAKPDGNLEYQIINNRVNDEYEKEGQINLGLEHAFKNKEEHVLTFEGAFSSFDEMEDQTYIQHYIVPDSIRTIDKNVIKKFGNQAEIQIDYTLPIHGDTEFNAGYSGEFVHENIKYTIDAGLSYFSLNRNIQALYAMYQQNLGAFNFQLGLRAEHAYTNPQLKIPVDSVVENLSTNFFPTLHLNYKISKNQVVSLSYSKRLNRPDADELNPYLEYSDPRNAEAGNPNLKPEKVHSLEFGYQLNLPRFTLASTLYYRYKYDAFASINRFDNSNLIITYADNLNSQQSGGLEVALSGELGGLVNYNLTGNIFKISLDASNLGYKSKRVGTSGNIKNNLMITISKNTYLQLNTYYYLPSINPQGKRVDFIYCNSGVKQNLFNDKLSVNLTITDVFNSYKRIRIMTSDDLNQKFSMKRKYSIIYFGITWSFNKNKHQGNGNFEYLNEGVSG